MKLNKWWSVRAIYESTKEIKIKKVMFYFCGTQKTEGYTHNWNFSILRSQSLIRNEGLSHKSSIILIKPANA